MYDSKCRELAEHFLQDESFDSEETRADLAEVIQAAVEGWFQSREADDPTPWCHACGAMSKAKCKCGPIAENA